MSPNWSRTGWPPGADPALPSRSVPYSRSPPIAPVGFGGAAMPRERAWRPDVAARIALDEARLESFCDRWRVERLELFGSVICDRFRPDSDVDVLITFRPGADWGLLDHAAMEEELATLFGRLVDLLSRRAVERSANHLRRTSILRSAEPLFTAAAEAESVSATVSERRDA